MKWQCNNCTNKDGLSPCILELNDDHADLPLWCPWALDPLSKDSCPNWVPILEIDITNTTARLNHDPVKHPSHYTEGRKYEPIKVIEDWKLDFCLGNALKYISRAGRKEDEIEDLKKARWYIKRRIKQLKKGKK